MLETIRDYAQERLAESGDASAIHARHRDWFVGLVEQARPGFFAGAEQAQWLARLAEDHDNLRAALRWSDEDPDGASAELSLASGLWRFWEIRGHLAEGGAWLERALARPVARSRRAEPADSPAPECLPRSVATTRPRPPPRGEPASASRAREPTRRRGRVQQRGQRADRAGQLDRARELYARASSCTAPPGFQQGVGFSLLNLADLTARQGDDAEADKLYAESMAPSRRWGTCGALPRRPHGWRS